MATQVQVVTVSHTYSSNGIYNVQLIITGVTGCKDTFNMPVPVTIFNSPSVSISGPSVTCPATPVTFNSSVQSTDAIATLEWSSTDGGTGSGNDYTHSFNLPGSYTVQLIATTVNGCADTSYHTIIVHAIPVVTPVANQTVCNGAMINTINLSSNPSGSTISWTNDYPSIGLAASGTGDIPAFTAVNTGSTQAIANITVTAVSNGCSSTTETFTITVNPDPTIFQPANQTVCNGGVTTGVIFNSFTSAVSNCYQILTGQMISLLSVYQPVVQAISLYLQPSTIPMHQSLLISQLRQLQVHVMAIRWFLPLP
ncbi:MAG: PKD domain-containing protein [Ferruginibacter sp.]